MKFLPLSLCCATAIFASNVAEVTALHGNAKLDTTTPITLHQKLNKQTTITTEAKSKLQLKFIDDTIITIGENAEFSIEEYLIDEENSKVELKASKGNFRFLTGQIGKLAPKRFSLQTKTATMGIRGTDVAFSTNDTTTGVLYLGRGKGVVVSNDKGEVVLDEPGEGVNLNRDEPPGRIKNWKKEKVNALLNSLSFMQNDQLPSANTSFLKESQLSGIWRSYYIATDKDRLSNKEALATGGELSYTSSEFLNTKANISLFSTNALYTPGVNVDGSVLSGGGNKDNINVLGIANLEFSTKHNTLILGRQKLATPLMHHKTVRMIPTTFEGLTVDSKYDFASFKVAAITKMKQRYDHLFYNLGDHVFKDNSKNSVLFANITKKIDTLKIALWDYEFASVMSAQYLQLDYKYNSISFAAQALKQKSSNNLATKIDATLLGAKVHYKQPLFTLSLAVNRSGKGSDIFTPWDGTPAFTDSMVSNTLESSNYAKGITGITGISDSIYVKGVTSFKMMTSLKLSTIGIEKSQVSLSYANYKQADSLKTRVETDLVFVKKEIFSAVDLKAVYIRVENEKFGGTKTDPKAVSRSQYRLILNYPFNI
jgi:hypothetical protein